MEFYTDPRGITLLCDTTSSDNIEPAALQFKPSSLFCEPPRRSFLVNATSRGRLPAPLRQALDRGFFDDLLEVEGPGILRHKKSAEAYQPAQDDLLRLVTPRRTTFPRACALALGSVPSSSLYVNLDQVRKNLAVFAARAGDGVKVMAMVKCDGYGAGAAPVARACLEAGAHSLAVTSPEEAYRLRRAAIACPILVLNFAPEEAHRLVAQDLEAVVYLPEQAEALAASSAINGTRARAHLKVDTGLSRYGIPADQAADFLARWQGGSHLEFVGLMTHLSHANEPLSDRVNHRQLNRFARLLETLKSRNLAPTLVHAANSAAVARYQDSFFTMIRPGAGLYGIRSYPGITSLLNLGPAVSWCARVAQVRTVKAGRGVGYGGMFIARRDSRVATVLVGYGDGFPGGMANRARVLVSGHSAPVVGAVSMDCICVDLTDLPPPEPAPGQEVILVGGPEKEVPSGSAGEFITLEEAASAAGCSAYELLSGIGPRVARVYRTSD